MTLRNPVPGATILLSARLLLGLSCSAGPEAAHTAGARMVDGETFDPVQLVDPLVGTAVYGGALPPAACLPYGFVKLSPDTTHPSTAGYNPTEPIVGFSHTHIGGTGGGAFGGQILVRPQSGPIDVGLPPSPKTAERAAPGYYTVRLERDGVKAELTVGDGVGAHRYTFDRSGPARLLIDVAATLNNAGAATPSSHCVSSAAHFTSDQELEGQASFIGGSQGLRYTVYFCARFDRAPAARGAWLGRVAQPDALSVNGGASQPAGLYAEFSATGGEPLGLRVGLSYSSVARARQHLELCQAATFDEIRARAEEKWRTQLNSIRVDGGTENERRQFYTALYDSALAPAEMTADNEKWPYPGPSYWEIYCLWDTFRCAGPLLTLLQPRRQAAIVSSLLDDYRQTGWLPDAWHYNQTAFSLQGGTNADIVFADAIAKGLTGFDRELAYEAVKKNATVPAAGRHFNRGGRQRPYFTLGYVPASVVGSRMPGAAANDYDAAVSSTLEYAYDDFAAATVAAATGHPDEAERLRQRSLSAYHLFNPQTQFFWGRTEQGEWIPGFDPKLVTKGPGWTGIFYEGSAWQYRFFVPHDIQGLIRRLGGRESFIAALDAYFDGGYHDQGNEPGFLSPWLHVYAGRPDKNVDRVRSILAHDYRLAAAGYQGDEDVGAMSSWYVFGAMGFFPNAGQDVYLLASPLFATTVLRLGDSGKTLTIRAENLSAANRYVQSATLNGRAWDKAWFQHRDIVGGAELILTMGARPSAWGTKLPPPSLTR